MVYFLFYLGTKNIMLNLPFLFPFNFLFLSFSFLLIIFSNFLCYFLPQKTANSIKSHIYIMFPLLSFYFLSMFLFVSFRVSFFSFSFFSLVISDLRAFLFLSSRSLFPTRFNLTLPPPRRILFSSRFRRSGGTSPLVRYCPRSKVQRDKIGIFLPHPGPLL